MHKLLTCLLGLLALAIPCPGGEEPAPQEVEAEVPPAATPVAPPPEKLNVLKELVKLRGREYCEARAVLLRTSTEKELREFREVAGGEESLVLVCDALLWRAANSKTAALLDKHGPAPLPAGAAVPRDASSQELWGDQRAARVLVSCFGPEALPALAEHLLYEGRPVGYRLSVVDTLVELRDARSPGVLLAAAGRESEEPRVRAAAVWRLEKCLSGVPALNMPYAAGKGPVGLGPPVIPELAELAKPVKLPALEPKDAERDRLVDELGRVLGADKDSRVRALAAKALRHGGAESVPALAKALSADQSSWVRAWCVDTLRRLGLPEARTALESAKGTEKDGEVRTVLDGHAEPALPEQGVPGKSIVKVRS